MNERQQSFWLSEAATRVHTIPLTTATNNPFTRVLQAATFPRSRTGSNDTGTAHDRRNSFANVARAAAACYSMRATHTAGTCHKSIHLHRYSCKQRPFGRTRIQGTPRSTGYTHAALASWLHRGRPDTAHQRRPAEESLPRFHTPSPTTASSSRYSRTRDTEPNHLRATHNNSVAP